MWGDNWGEMVWGGIVPQVPFGPLALLLLGIGLGVFGVRIARMRRARVITVALVLTLPAVAAALNLPHRFENGTPANADAVNANFEAVAEAIDANPPLASVNGLAGGKLSGDLVVTGTVATTGLLLPNGSIKSDEDRIVVTHDGGPEVVMTADGIELNMGTSVLRLTATEAHLGAATSTVVGTRSATVEGAATEVRASGNLDIIGALVKDQLSGGTTMRLESMNFRLAVVLLAALCHLPAEAGQPAARLTDGASSALVAGGGVACIGGPISGPGVSTVLIGNLPAATVGDVAATACGIPQTIVRGSATVLIGGRPAARVGDTTSQGGIIVGPGLPTVLVGG